MTISYLVANQMDEQGVCSGNAGSLGAVQEIATYSVYPISR